MIINKLTLKNFRSYEEECTFDFTPNGDKNVILIGGENGAGKSTIFEAIKLCFYGPATYGYQGYNSNYISRIKGNINNNAFKHPNVESFIELQIEMPEGNNINNYSIKRIWSYEDKKINEEYSVYKNGTLLANEELSYFENYFKSLLPPMLFDFFFFDGEELSDFFIGRGAKTHLKEALLKLCNYDTIELLRKQILQFQRSKLRTNTDTSDLEKKYSEQLNVLRAIDLELKDEEKEISELKETLEALSEERHSLEIEFIKQGGMLETERGKITSKINKLEESRTIKNQEIKDFSNDTLPFLILSDKLVNLRDQIEKEDKFNLYNNVRNRFDSNVIKDYLSENDILKPDKNIDDIAVDILSKITSNMFGEESQYNSFKELHKLSSDQSADVLSLSKSIIYRKVELKKDIKDKYNDINHWSIEIEKLKKKLTSSADKHLVEEYITSIKKITNDISAYEFELQKHELNIESLMEEKQKADYHLVRAKNEYTTALQSDNNLQLSSDVSDLLESIIVELTATKLKEIENNYMEIFSKLIRKTKYVENVIIDSDFNITLYINRLYNTLEIANKYNTIGYDEMARKFGDKFIVGLSEYYNTHTKKGLSNKLSNIKQSELINLNTKVNVDEFSKGEKQIYILCLIWALIKASDVKVPFIIDTPYARIDESHRNSITTEFLPNVSNQVIILSTNKEIDKESYDLIHKHVANEYLLQYMDIERKTKVSNRYFFEV